MGFNVRGGGKGFSRGGRGAIQKGPRKSFKPRRGPRFSSSRLAEAEENSENEVTGDLPPEEDHAVEDDDTEANASDDDGESTVAERPYENLMRSLRTSSGPPAKRRKVTGEVAERQHPEAHDGERQSQGGSEDVDEVKEAEESADAVDIETGPLLDEEDELDSSDPYEAHFATWDEREVAGRVKRIAAGQWQHKREILQDHRVQLSNAADANADQIALPKAITRLEELPLKRRLAEILLSKKSQLDTTESLISPFLFHYHDLLFCQRSPGNADSLRRAACLHAVNHVFKTRDRVIKNNARLSREDGNDDLELRDQGFTRPKVLFLLPTRQSCVKMVDMITSICQPDQQENRTRFDDAFIEKEEKFSADKPADFRDLFGGNDDDMFRIGVKFTRKTIKYYAQFYNSDILIASPLGLRMAIGSEEEKDKKLDFDFLSSVELVVVDQADALLMQNWEHVEFIFEHLNLQPKESHGCDFSRVRNWYLENQAKYFRQTVIFTAFNTPELAELFRLHCNNWAGKAKIQPEYQGVIQSLHGAMKAKQTFCRFELASVASDPESRFAYFTSTIVPTLTKRAKDSSGTLIFIPSYLDFVRVRNYFASSGAVQSLSFGTISEYADVAEASRARSHFLSGRHRVLLYTERAHHFRRYRIRGVKRVIMYGLPDNPVFYQEIVGGYLGSSEQGFVIEPGQGSVKIMFSKYDVLKLERVVGTKRVGKMIHDRGDTFEFV